jgi:hypothetical protein
MSTTYERVYGKPLPARFHEIEVCAGCGAPTKSERDCGCPAGTNCRAVRNDGEPLTAADRTEIFGPSAGGEGTPT